MARSKAHYSRQSFSESLEKIGISSGDELFIHSNIGFFGLAEGADSSDATCELILQAVFDVIGTEGTLLVPTFTYSFGSNKDEKIFDINHTPTTLGAFSEFVRTRQNSVRTRDPMFAVSAIGKKAATLTGNLSKECFGRNSIWHRLHEINAKCCNFNFNPGYGTFVHYVEKALEVSYRQDRLFQGLLVENGKQEELEVTYFSNDLDTPEFAVDLSRIENLCTTHGGQIAKVGRGKISVIHYDQIYRLIEKELPRNPYFLTASG